MALACFKSATPYKASPMDKCCLDLLVFSTRFCSAEMQKFNSYGTKIYNAVFFFFGERKRATIGASCSLRDVPEDKVSLPAFKEKVALQEILSSALQTLLCFNETLQRSQKSVWDTLFQLSTAIDEKFRKSIL